MDGRSHKRIREKIIRRKTLAGGILSFFLLSVLMTAIFAGSLWRQEKKSQEAELELIGRLREQFYGQESELMEAIHGWTVGTSEKEKPDEKNLGKKTETDYRNLAEEMLAVYDYEKVCADGRGEELWSCIIFFFGIFFLIGGGWIFSEKQYEKQKIRERLELWEQKLSLLNAGEYEKVLEKTEAQAWSGEDMFSRMETKLSSLGRTMETLMERMQSEKEGVKSLVTDISHQLKTPLASLKMELELAKEMLAAKTKSGKEKWNPTEIGQFLEQLQGEVKRLESLTAGLTNISRLEAGMVQLRPEWCDLKETLIEAVNAVYMKAFEKQVEIEFQEVSKQEIFHDRTWTKEAFVNLLDNAVKYSGEGATIHIRMEELVNSVVTEIEDEGIGIPKEEYPKVFQRFYRGRSKEVYKQEGAGVGLYLVRKIVEMQDGSVMIRPAVGGGSVFRVIFLKNDRFVRKDERKM